MSQMLILVMKRVARFLENDLNIYLKTVLEIGLQRSGVLASFIQVLLPVQWDLRSSLTHPCSLAARHWVGDTRHNYPQPGC